MSDIKEQRTELLRLLRENEDEHRMLRIRLEYLKGRCAHPNLKTYGESGHLVTQCDECGYQQSTWLGN